jgi:hypothetical protein
MRGVTGAALALLMLFIGTTPATGAAIEAVPVDEIRPGLRGVLLTVLEGERPDSLPVEVVGVLNRPDPDRHIVLIRGLDARLARTGIAAGMSGSPIYVGDRLLGAMAFAFVGATEPIGGATPYAEMLATLSGSFSNPPAGGEPRHSALPPGGPEIAPFPEWRKRWAASLGSLEMPGARAIDADLPEGLRPIELPVSFGGALGKAGGQSRTWSALGLTPWVEMDVATGTAAGGGGGRGTLRPGDAFGIALITGDMQATAIGTVTSVDGERVLGLGHPAFHLSPIETPITRARIHTVIPTNNVSFKVGSALEEVGSLIADRQPGIAALLGRRAPRIPLEVAVRAGDQEHRYRFDVVRSDILTPSLMAAAVDAALTRHYFALGQATLATHLRITLDDGRVLERRDLFQTIGPGQTASGDAMAPVAYLAGTGLAPFSVASVALDIDLVPEIRAARVDRIDVPRARFHPGDRVEVTVRLLRSLDGPEERRVTLRIPETVPPGRILLAAGSAEAFFAWDQDRAPQKYVPRTFDDLLRLMREYPSDESLIVRLYGPSRGVVLQGRELSSLPLSKWRALSGSTAASQAATVSGRILDESVTATGEVIQGGEIVELEVVR